MTALDGPCSVPGMTSRPGLLMADEVAQELRVTTKTVRKLAKSGQLPAIKIGAHWRFRQADVDAFGAGELIPVPSA